MSVAHRIVHLGSTWGADILHLVCPHCSNALTISRADRTPEYPLGVNRFECRTCPYQYPLNKTFFEEMKMKQKEVDDVRGGKEEFANADSMASKSSCCGIILWL